MMNYSNGFWMMGWMWVFWILLLVGLAILIVLLVRLLGGGMSTRHGAGPGEAANRPLEILRERYARGELTTEEYQERLRTLREADR